MATDLNLTISIIVFALAIIFFLYKKRKHIEVQYKFIFLYKTQTGIKLIRDLALKLKRFWIWFGYFAIPAGFIGMFITIYFLTKSLVDLAITPTTIGSVGLVIPGVTGPFWYIMISLILVILVHEGCHGLVAEAWGFKLKAVGFGFLAILPIAFVEPNEEKLMRAPLKKQLSVFGAGPFANLVSALIIAGLLIFTLNPLVTNVIEPDGILLSKVDGGLPADIAGLEKGDILVELDGQSVKEFESFVSYLETVKPNQEVQILLSDNTEHTIVTTNSPYNSSKGYLGVKPTRNIDISEEYQRYGYLAWLLIYFTKLLNWMFILNIGIGLVNLLPLGPTDGGRMLDALLKNKTKKKKAKKIFSVVSAFALFLLVANLIVPYLLKLFI